MRHYGLFHPLGLAFYSKDLYVDVARNWKGAGILYLLMILTISWVLICIKIHLWTTNFIATDGKTFAAKVPTIKLTKGVADVDVEQPYIINGDTGKPELIIDTTGQHVNLDNLPETKFLLTKTQLFTRDRPGQVKVFELSQFPDFVLDQPMIQQFMNELGKWLALALFPICWLFSVMYRLIQLLIYALVGSAIASSLRLKLDFITLMRITAVALTPVLVLDTIVWLSGFDVPGWSAICLFLAIAYIYFGLNAVALKPPPPPTDPTEVEPSDEALAPAPKA